MNSLLLFKFLFISFFKDLIKWLNARYHGNTQIHSPDFLVVDWETVGLSVENARVFNHLNIRKLDVVMLLSMISINISGINSR